MPRRRLTVLAATLGLSALALTACSGGATSEATPGAGSEYGLVSDGTLTVATEGTYRPFSYHEGAGDLTGFDVEIAQAVGEKLGLEVTFQETQWDAIFAGLDAGRFDVIANQVSINPEREEKYTFSTPYTVSRGVVVTADTDNSISSFADLSGKTTAQSLTSNWYELATESGALLKQGRVDATVNDQLTYLDYEKTNSPTGLKIAAETDDTSESAFAFKKGQDALAQAVDGALEELRADGTLAEISEKYFGDDVTQ
jgi:cystine transport system substrate-binding protein